MSPRPPLLLLLLLVYRHVVGGRYGEGEEGLLSLSGEIANLCPTTHLELHFTPVLIKWGREGWCWWWNWTTDVKVVVAPRQ